MHDPLRLPRFSMRRPSRRKVDPYTEYVQNTRPELVQQRRERRRKAAAYIAAAVILGVLLALLLNRT